MIEDWGYFEINVIQNWTYLLNSFLSLGQSIEYSNMSDPHMYHFIYWKVSNVNNCTKRRRTKYRIVSVPLAPNFSVFPFIRKRWWLQLASGIYMDTAEKITKYSIRHDSIRIQFWNSGIKLSGGVSFVCGNCNSGFTLPYSFNGLTTLLRGEQGTLIIDGHLKQDHWLLKGVKSGILAGIGCPYMGMTSAAAFRPAGRRPVSHSGASSSFAWDSCRPANNTQFPPVTTEDRSG